MSLELVKQYLESYGLSDRILVYDASSATVALAAKAIGTAPEHIAKSLTFGVDGGCVMIVMAGDARVDNAKFKAMFHTKCTMLSAQQALEFTGHAVGGICPFALPEEVRVFFDVSLRRFDMIYPAAGSANSCVRLTPSELAQCVERAQWVDVCRGWQENNQTT